MTYKTELLAKYNDAVRIESEDVQRMHNARQEIARTLSFASLCSILENYDQTPTKFIQQTTDEIPYQVYIHFTNIQLTIYLIHYEFKALSETFTQVWLLA